MPRNVPTNTQGTPNAPNAPPTPNTANTPKNKKPKRTFMLHAADDMTALGRFISTDWRYAALKAASRGHTQILLRQTGTREVRKFDGQKVEIEPKQITRGGRTITYTHRPQVKYNGKFTYAGAIDDTTKITNPVRDPN
jgi:hypothetical protein